MKNDLEYNAAPRQRLLAISAALLEAVFDAGAVAVLSTLGPRDMHPGGARVPGTSYELEAETAARAIRDLLALRGVRADVLAKALANADLLARYAMLAGETPPTLTSLYAHCTPDLSPPGSESLEAALAALESVGARIFTPTQSRRIAQLCEQWRADPTRVDAMPVQQFVALLVRNAP